MSSIQAAAGTQAGGVSSTSGFSSMDSEEFVKIIFTELQNQDPFQPNDSSALLEQLNSIRSIESDMALTDQLKDIVFQNQLSGAGNLIGRYVQGMTGDGNRVDGKVISVIRQGDAIGVELDTGWILEVDQVELIVDEAMFEAPGNGQAGGTGIADLDGNGVIDGTDLTLLLGQWDDEDQSDGSSAGSGEDDAAGSDAQDPASDGTPGDSGQG